MIRKQDNGRSGGSRWLGAAAILLSGSAFVGAASCAEGEEVPLFENAGGKSAGGHAGTIVGTSGSSDNGGSGGSGQGGSGQGGSGQAGSGKADRQEPRPLARVARAGAREAQTPRLARPTRRPDATRRRSRERR